MTPVQHVQSAFQASTKATSSQAEPQVTRQDTQTMATLPEAQALPAGPSAQVPVQAHVQAVSHTDASPMGDRLAGGGLPHVPWPCCASCHRPHVLGCCSCRLDVICRHMLEQAKWALSSHMLLAKCCMLLLERCMRAHRWVHSSFAMQQWHAWISSAYNLCRLLERCHAAHLQSCKHEMIADVQQHVLHTTVTHAL